MSFLVSGDLWIFAAFVPQSHESFAHTHAIEKQTPMASKFEGLCFLNSAKRSEPSASICSGVMPDTTVSRVVAQVLHG